MGGDGGREVVFADADLDTALDSALFGVMSLNGERCTAGSRILVERTVYDSFLARRSEPLGFLIDFFAWSVHDVAFILGSLSLQGHIERGPGRQGVSNAFYVYLRDPTGTGWRSTPPTTFTAST